MNPAEQRDRRTAVQRLEADLHRTKEDVTVLLEQGLRVQQHAHQKLVAQHEAVVKKQQTELQAISDNLTKAAERRHTELKGDIAERTEVLRRWRFWGRLRWLLRGD